MSYVETKGVTERAEVQKGTTDVLTFWPADAGKLLTVTPGTQWVTILDPSGSELVARTQDDVTIAADKSLQFSKLWNEELQEDFIAVWEYEVGGAVRIERQRFDVVLCRLRCRVTESDLLEEYPDASDLLAGIGEADPSKFIRRAWSKLLSRIRAARNRPSLILDDARLIDPALQLALFYMTKALQREAGDVWAERWKHHLEAYDRAWSELGELKYDIDQDGLAGECETKRINRKVFTV